MGIDRKSTRSNFEVLAAVRILLDVLDVDVACEVQLHPTSLQNVHILLAVVQDIVLHSVLRMDDAVVMRGGNDFNALFLGFLQHLSHELKGGKTQNPPCLGVAKLYILTVSVGIHHEDPKILGCLIHVAQRSLIPVQGILKSKVLIKRCKLLWCHRIHFHLLVP